MPVYLGWFTLPTAFAPAQWHAHEMIFGIVIASLAGFLLTAIPNWTGRLPLRGGALIALASLWLAGRLATLLASEIGPVAASLIDLAFLPVLLAVIVREIVAGRNWRNLPITIAVGRLFAANLLMHLEVLEMFETDGHGLRLAIATMIMLIGLVGGRVIPSFTRNWLAKRDAAHLPAAFGRFDGIVLTLQLAALVGWIVAPEALWVGWALVGAGGHGGRAARTMAGRGYAFRAFGLEPSSWIFVDAGRPVPLGLIIDHAGCAPSPPDCTHWARVPWDR